MLACICTDARERKHRFFSHPDPECRVDFPCLCVFLLRFGMETDDFKMQPSSYIHIDCNQQMNERMNELFDGLTS